MLRSRVDDKQHTRGTYVKIVRNMLPTRVTAWAVGVLGRPGYAVRCWIYPDRLPYSRIRSQIHHGPGDRRADGLWCPGQQLDGGLVDHMLRGNLCKIPLGTGGRVRRYTGSEDLRCDR